MAQDAVAHVLEARRVRASWHGVAVLHDVSLAVRAGSFVCLCGPNGSGKSTLLTALAGLAVRALRVTCAPGGQAPAFDGREVRTMERREAARHIAYMVQGEVPAWNHTVRDMALAGRFCHTAGGAYSAHDYAVADDALRALGIAHLAGRGVFSLSGGEFQKVRIARSLAQEPDMLLLDEPAASLDFGYQAELLALLRDLAHTQHRGVLVSIHDINMAARFADTLALLPRLARTGGGTTANPVIAGEPPHVLRPDVLRRVYGCECAVFAHPADGAPQAYRV